MKPRTKNVLILFIIIVGIMCIVAPLVLGSAALIVYLTTLSLTDVLLSLISVILMTIAIGIYNK